LRHDYEVSCASPSLAVAAELLAVDAVSLCDSDYSPAELAQLWANDALRVYVARCGRQLVGFCACLLTEWPWGRQLEVDALGVVPEHRRRGLAKRLVAKAIRKARGAGALWARAVVREDNAPSKAVFRALGFASGDVRDMLAYECRQRDGTLAPGLAHMGWERIEAKHSGNGWAEVQVVQTMAYRGLWIEGLELPPTSEGLGVALVAAILQHAVECGVDEVGWLAPHRGHPLRGCARAAGFSAHGRYRYWLADLA